MAELQESLRDETEVLKERIRELEHQLDLIQKKDTELQKNFKEAQELSKTGNWEYNVVTGSIRWSENLFTLLGKDPETYEPSLEGLFSMIHPEDRDTFRSFTEIALQTGTVYSLDFRMNTADEIRYFHSRGRSDLDENGKVVRLIGTSEDITERKMIEATRKELEILSRIIEISSQAVGFGKPDGRIIYGNHAYEKLTGYSKEELQKTGWKALTPPEYLEKEAKILEKLIRTGVPVQYKKEYIRKDGSRVPVELLVHLMKDKEGKIDFFYAFINDITEQKKQEDLLRKTNEELEIKVQERTALLSRTLQDLETERHKLEQIFNLIPFYVMVLNSDYRIVFANQVFHQLFGKPGKLRCYEMVYNRTTVCEGCQVAVAFNTHKSNHWEWVGPDDKPYDIYDYPFTDSSGENMILELGIDISEKKNLEQYVMSKIFETEERDRKRFASDLHDDLGPLLSAIKLQFGMIASEKDAKVREELITICEKLLSEGIEKMRNVANTIMPSLLEKLGLEAAVGSFLDRLAKTNTFQINYISNLGTRRFDGMTELHLYRITTELVNNTIKHSGGNLINLAFHFQDGHLTLKYSDNGQGYSIHALPDDSTGIGLSNILNRVNLINGTLRFKHDVGITEVIIHKFFGPESI